MNKIILINTPSAFQDEPAMNPPPGLCSIIGVLKANGYYDITGIDFNLHKFDYYNNDDFLQLIPLDGGIYGISMTSSELYWGRKIAKYIKQHNKNCLLIYGGPHANTEPEELLAIEEIDAIVRGDGEYAFLDIVKGKDLSTIEGVSCKGHITPETYVKDLNTLPVADREIFNINKYHRELGGKKAAHLLTMRGCPYRCRFCAQKATGKKIRLRSIEHVMKEIDEIIKKYGITSFVIYDDTFTTYHNRVKDFCKEFKKRNITWRCWSRTDTLTEDLLITMKDSGLLSLTFGIESGDNKILEMANKKETVKSHVEAIKLCHKFNIPHRISLIYGIPGETRETLQNTLEFMAMAQPDEWFLYILSPTCGSEFWQNPEKYGLHFDKQAIKDSDYVYANFADKSGIGNIWITIDSMTQQEFKNNLIWFIDELKRVCPCKTVQNTYQNIHIDKIESKQ